VERLVRDLAFQQAAAQWKDERFENEGGLKANVVKKHGGLVYERYRGEPSYLGKYDVGFGGGAEKLVPEATKFILESIDKADRADAIRNGATETEYETKVLGRIGQREFRKNLEVRWDHKCAITECGIPQALRASHIIPWRSDRRLRLDPN